MKPYLEKVISSSDSSWTMLNRRLEDGIPFEWHHHPEYELTLTRNSIGQRFVGDHIGAYGDSDLVLLGPNLPHTWSSSERIESGEPHVALVMWFKAEWASTLTSVLVELAPVASMLEGARHGLKFSEATADVAAPMIEALFEAPPPERLLALIGVLTLLAEDHDAMPLSSPTRPEALVSISDRPRIERVLEHIHAHYAGDISIAQLADVAALSASGFHRLFRRHTRLTVSAYVARLRIGQACALLSASDRPIAHIADQVGYRSLANFNRQFRAQKKLTPRAFRNRFQPMSH